MILKPSVGAVREGSPAFNAGLQEGDLIAAIDVISSRDKEFINFHFQRTRN